MTEREYEGLRRGNAGYYSGHRSDEEEEPRDGYFAFFKLRCLICLVLLLGLITVNQQFELKKNEKVAGIMALLGQEEITIEECMGIIK